MTARDREALAGVDRAVLLVGAVRDLDVDAIGDLLRTWTPRQATVALVALAAMVPDDRTPGELTEWLWRQAQSIDADADVHSPRTDSVPGAVDRPVEVGGDEGVPSRRRHRERREHLDALYAAGVLLPGDYRARHRAADVARLTGVLPDREIAERLGIHRESVPRIRHRLRRVEVAS